MSQKNRKNNRSGKNGQKSRARATKNPQASAARTPSAPDTPVRHPAVSVDQARRDLQASGQQQGSPGMLIIALLGATLFMFFYLHVIALPQMSALAGGLPMPDHRFLYSAADLAELDAAMDSAAHGQLNWVHKTAGVIFPLFMAVCAAGVAAWALPRGAGRWLTYTAGLVFAAVDIAENMLIDAALEAGGEGAGLASTFTSARWILLVVLAAWVVLMVAVKVRRLLAERAARNVA